MKTIRRCPAGHAESDAALWGALTRCSLRWEVWTIRGAEFLVGIHSRFSHQGYAVCSVRRVRIRRCRSFADLHSNLEFERSKRSCARTRSCPPAISEARSSTFRPPIPLNLAIYVPGVGECQRQLLPQWPGHSFQSRPRQPPARLSPIRKIAATLSFLNPASANEIGRLAIIANGGTQSYNGMLLSVQRRANRGVNLNGNYTWSHCIGDYAGRSNNGYGTSVDHTYQDPQQPPARPRQLRNRPAAHLQFDGGGRDAAVCESHVEPGGTGWRLSGIYRASTAGTIIASSQASGIRTVTLGSRRRASATSARWRRGSLPLRYQQPTPRSGFAERISRQVGSARNAIAESGGIRDSRLWALWEIWAAPLCCCRQPGNSMWPVARIPFPRNTEHGVSSRSV